jgi:hypothetical protein
MAAAPLVVGIVLSVLSGVVRVRAWRSALVHACPGRSVRYRDVVVAHLGGAGLNVVPLHPGEAVKVGLLKRRDPDLPAGLLIGSFAPPAVVEAFLSVVLVAWAASSGLLEPPSLGQVPPIAVAGVVLLVALAWVLARRAPRLIHDLRRGIAGVAHPRLLLVGIAPWLLAARAIRLAAIGCFMVSVGLPATIAGALLVMAIQGGVGAGGPASGAVRVAVLAASLPTVTGAAVHLDTAAALVGAQLLASGAGLAMSVLVLALLLRTLSPRLLLGHCREAAARMRALPQPLPGDQPG